jgi:hypothetical protein
MVAITFRFNHTVHIRRPTMGGQDSEFSHSEIQKGELTIIVPRDDEEWYGAARMHVYHYAGNNKDPNFHLLDPVEKRPVHMILGKTMRLD